MLNGDPLLSYQKKEEIFRNTIIKYYPGLRMGIIVYPVLCLLVFIPKPITLEIKHLDTFIEKL